jgi:hypothetical protein
MRIPVETCDADFARVYPVANNLRRGALECAVWFSGNFMTGILVNNRLYRANGPGDKTQ